jgi:hypothetical protein
MSEITRRMARIIKLFDIHISLPGARRAVIKPQLWCFLWGTARAHSFRLPIFVLHFSKHWVLLGALFNYIFIVYPVYVWPPMFVAKDWMNFGRRWIDRVAGSDRSIAIFSAKVPSDTCVIAAILREMPASKRSQSTAQSFVVIVLIAWALDSRKSHIQLPIFSKLHATVDYGSLQRHSVGSVHSPWEIGRHK